MRIEWEKCIYGRKSRWRELIAILENIFLFGLLKWRAELLSKLECQDYLVGRLIPGGFEIRGLGQQAPDASEIV
jgi:hypothetical protein